MLKIDPDKMMISLTRGDSATIVFSAVDDSGNVWHPSQAGEDTLTLGVAKKVGAEPVFQVSNVYNGNEEEFWSIQILPEHTNDLKFADYAWDLQLETSTGVDTIIGKTDKLSPIFKVWGEVAREVSE